MLLRDYGKSIDKCLFLVPETVQLTRSSRACCPLVGCASHRLDLATRELLEEFESDLSAVQALMTKLKSLNLAAKLTVVCYCMSLIM